MRINSWLLGILVVVIIFGGIEISSLTGSWQTESTKIPAKYSSGEFAGQYNPADIRGSYTFGEISKTFEIPLSDLATAFGIETRKAPAEVQVKELEALYIDPATGNSVGTNSVRVFVALYKGLPITLSNTDYLLPAAYRILKDKSTLTAEQMAFLNNHVLQTPASPVPLPSITIPSTSEPTHTATTGTITGKTTFQELLDWGVKEEAIQFVIKDSLPSKSLIIKDYASQKGLDFSALKTELQALVAPAK
jgi:hypothetical protein